eukprot:scaffold23270_cov65-Phaeocystis_antarctica.AAC.5
MTTCSTAWMRMRRSAVSQRQNIRMPPNITPMTQEPTTSIRHHGAAVVEQRLPPDHHRQCGRCAQGVEKRHDCDRVSGREHRTEGEGEGPAEVVGQAVHDEEGHHDRAYHHARPREQQALPDAALDHVPIERHRLAEDERRDEDEDEQVAVEALPESDRLVDVLDVDRFVRRQESHAHAEHHQRRCELDADANAHGDDGEEHCGVDGVLVVRVVLVGLERYPRHRPEPAPGGMLRVVRGRCAVCSIDEAILPPLPKRAERPWVRPRLSLSSECPAAPALLACVLLATATACPADFFGASGHSRALEGTAVVLRLWDVRASRLAGSGCPVGTARRATHTARAAMNCLIRKAKGR